MSSKHNFIVHRFEEFSRITEVLAEGFVPNYHAEDLRLLKDLTDVMYIGIPMVSFGDIEDNNISDYMKNADSDYGEYAILMKKEWALRQLWMSPVWYLTTDMLNLLKRNWKVLLESGIVGYCKKYISEWKGDPYNNYAEREWRYTVPITKVKWILTKEAYDTWRNYPVLEKRPAPTEELTKHTLRFDIEDIDGIVVSDKKDIENIRSFLHTTEIFSGTRRNLSPTEINRLLELVIITE